MVDSVSQQNNLNQQFLPAQAIFKRINEEKQLTKSTAVKKKCEVFHGTHFLPQNANFMGQCPNGETAKIEGGY